jgi:multisubunit Na+/H+ antiporter MnhC subunit
MAEYISLFAVAMFFLSFYGIFISNNIIKSIIFVLLMQASVITFWLTLGVGEDTTPYPPIIYDAALLENVENIADPVPQAITITTIIIGFSVVAIVLTMLNTLHRQYGTTDWKKLRKLSTEGDE